MAITRSNSPPPLVIGQTSRRTLHLHSGAEPGCDREPAGCTHRPGRTIEQSEPRSRSTADRRTSTSPRRLSEPEAGAPSHIAFRYSPSPMYRTRAMSSLRAGPGVPTWPCPHHGCHRAGTDGGRSGSHRRRAGENPDGGLGKALRRTRSAHRRSRYRKLFRRRDLRARGASDCYFVSATVTLAEAFMVSAFTIQAYCSSFAMNS